MKSFVAKKEDINQEWFVVDATDLILGRLASEVARRLRGKHKAIFTPNVDTGDFIIVVNAEKIRLTGRKMDQKMYHRHSGYPGGIRSVNARRLLDTFPERVLTIAVRGMLPKTRLGRQMIKKLKVYAGPEHPHEAQRPQQLSLS